MPRIVRLSHATFETPDLARQVAFYRDVMGFRVTSDTTRRAVLHNAAGLETLVFETGDSARCTALALQTDGDPTGLAPVLAEAGIGSELRSDSTPGIGSMLTFTDLKGTRIELFGDSRPLAADNAPPQGVNPLKLGHIAFTVTDIHKTHDFYTNVLGFRVSDWMEDFFLFLRCNPDHHTVNFVAAGQSFMHHLAFELKDWAHVQTACDHLGQSGVKLIGGPGRHEIGHNIFVYHRDPDGHVIELFTELDQMKDESLGYFDPRPWHKDRPQRPKVWSRQEGTPSWGNPPGAPGSAEMRRPAG